MNNASSPRITEHKIIVLKKPNGSKQYLVTIPKQYAAELERKSIDRLVIIYNEGLACFPSSSPKVEEAIVAFLSHHSEFSKFFTTGQKVEK